MAEQSPNPDEQPTRPDAVPEDAAEETASPEQMAEDALNEAGRAAEELKRETSDEAGESAAANPDAGSDQGSLAGESKEEGVDDSSAGRVRLQDFATTNGEVERSAAGLSLLDDIDLQVKIELGRTHMYVEDVLRLNTNSVVELDKAAGDPVDIYVNDRHVARGEVLVLNENFCVRISEIVRLPDFDDEQ